MGDGQGIIFFSDVDLFLLRNSKLFVIFLVAFKLNVLEQRVFFIYLLKNCPGFAN